VLVGPVAPNVVPGDGLDLVAVLAEQLPQSGYVPAYHATRQPRRQEREDVVGSIGRPDIGGWMLRRDRIATLEQPAIARSDGNPTVTAGMAR
jgi:hypothetical protein